MLPTLHKYPRTPHLPDSPGATSDDRRWPDDRALRGMDVVVTEKMDGECTTLYRQGLHARSLTWRDHPSRRTIRRLHAEIAHLLPEGWRVCGENLFACHSIHYQELPAYFLVFSVWDDHNQCLDWEATRTFCERLGLRLVPELWTGVWTPGTSARLAAKLDRTRQEGFVVRPRSGFAYHAFAQCVAKWVRPDHVVTDEHWLRKPVVPNQLSGADGRTAPTKGGMT